MDNEYDTQAETFLKKHGIRFTVTRNENNGCPPSCDGKHIHGDKHTARFYGTGRSLQLPFWNSLRDSQKGNTPTAYDVLACISNDVGCPDTFEEFCDEYGYDTDSRKAYDTFKRVQRFSVQLHRFFSSDEIMDLQGID